MTPPTPLDRHLEAEAAHIGMNGKPCRCTAARRRRVTAGLSDLCPCHGLLHAHCPKARPCLGACGRLTTAHESAACGYCRHCAADAGWRRVA